MATNPLFELLDNFGSKKITEWDELSEELQKGYNQFMINRFLSSYDYLVPILGLISTRKLSNKSHFTVLMELVKPMKHYFNYKVYKKSEIDELLLKSILKEYDCGIREAKNYMTYISKEEKEELIEKYTDFFKYTENN